MKVVHYSEHLLVNINFQNISQNTQDQNFHFPPKIPNYVIYE